ncbi:MAG: ATP-grasp domain-containing protein, partial [Nocardioidaceae bacterium]
TSAVLQATGGDQVVWAGDASQGVNGGGDFVRWVRTEEQAREFAEFFAGECSQVRVSGFLEGVPCSIHGLVLTDGVVVLRPMELASLRDPSTGRFLFAGIGTTWNPPEADTRQMRQLARRIGEHLRDRHGYRGAYGIDGVLTADGFRVTELNTRMSGGLTRLGRAAPGAQLELVQMNALLGRDIGMTADAYEELAMELVDETRFIDVMGISSQLVSQETFDVPITVGAQRLEIAGLDDDVVGTVSRGPSPMGTYIRMTTVPGVIGIGDRAAPLSVLLLAFADREWGAGFGQVLVAPEVRRAAE